MEKIAENTFRGYMEQVPIQSGNWTMKHKVFSHDPKLYDGVNTETVYTPYGVTVEHAYELQIVRYELVFKSSN